MKDEDLVPKDRHYQWTRSGPWSRVRVPQAMFTAACETWGETSASLSDHELSRVYISLQKTLYMERKGKETGDMLDLIETEQQLEEYVMHRMQAAKVSHSHSDDRAVDDFAASMKYKLAIARGKGRSGWEECTHSDLNSMLHDHMDKGDPVDVANFCMFLHLRGFGIQKMTPVRPDYKLVLPTGDNRKAYVLTVEVKEQNVHELTIAVTGPQEPAADDTVRVGYWILDPNGGNNHFSLFPLRAEQVRAGWRHWQLCIPKDKP